MATKTRPKELSLSKIIPESTSASQGKRVGSQGAGIAEDRRRGGGESLHRTGSGVPFSAEALDVKGDMPT